MTEQRPRIGVMGGTFDPIHHGHLVAASEAAAELSLDEVFFVPTGQPAFKQHPDVTAAEHRYLMAVIATASNPRFTVSRVDIDRPGLTYTVDTLRELRAERPGADLFFISGADAIEQILSWKDAGSLWEMTHLVAVSRPGHTLSTAGIPEGAVSTLEVPALARQSVDEIARAGTSSVLTAPSGMPAVDRVCPGRLTATRCAISHSKSASFQDRICSMASAPLMKNRSAPGRSARSSRSVSTV